MPDRASMVTTLTAKEDELVEERVMHKRMPEESSRRHPRFALQVGVRFFHRRDAEFAEDCFISFLPPRSPRLCGEILLVAAGVHRVTAKPPRIPRISRKRSVRF